MSMFTTSYTADEISVRRANNVLIKNKKNFAVVYQPEYDRWVISVGDDGAKILDEAGITR